ncbi:MAG: DUF433 domain-containing protein [Bryobacteraceae bacterium]
MGLWPLPTQPIFPGSPSYRVRSGQPCIRGLRVTVWDVLDMLASGMTEDEVIRDYPYLEKGDFPAVYAYASQAGRERPRIETSV